MPYAKPPGWLSCCSTKLERTITIALTQHFRRPEKREQVILDAKPQSIGGLKVWAECHGWLQI
jgi:hypothetical protein